MGRLHGNNPEAVVRLLHDRKSDGYRPGGTTNRKLGLIVEGGGMRGVLSAGSLLAVDLLGYRHCFDEIYATSAGGVNAAYFLSGQGELGITVYFDSICNRKFINPLRLTKIVDVEFVYDHIVRDVKPLDEDALRSSGTRLYLSVTDVDTGDNVLIDTKTNPEPVHRVLKASSALPVLYNRTVALNGRHYVDGGISDAVPVEQAIAAGCTDILILLTKVRDHISDPPSLFEKSMFWLMMGRRYPKVMNAWLDLHAHSNRNRDLAIGNGSANGINIATVCPTDDELIVGRTTLDRSKLVEGSYLQAAKTFRFFSGSLSTLDGVYQTFRGQPVE